MELRKIIMAILLSGAFLAVTGCDIQRIACGASVITGTYKNVC